LDHDWHVQFLEDLTPYLDTFEAIGTSFGIKRPGWRTTKYWRTNAPDFRNRVEAARTITSNPAPRTQELTAVLDACTVMLDQTNETYSKMKPPRIKLPRKARQVDPAAKAVLKRAGIYVRREDRRENEEKVLAKIGPVTGSYAKNTREIIALVQVLIALAVSNVYLNGHHELGEYPSSQVHYDESLSLVSKFAEMRKVLGRCLEMAMTHSAAFAE
jgi:hypothetical protein